MDVVTAFLRAPMPEVCDKEAVYVKPPALFEQFKIIKPNTCWKLTKAVYGLRVSPRLWGKERDKQLRIMKIQIKNEMFKFFRHLWMLLFGY